MTILEALKATAQELNGIVIPVSMIQQVGIPVTNAIGNIRACIDAIEKSEQKDEKDVVTNAEHD